jgi:glycosyltransferase involved in cell wall biosynthesis
MTSIAVIVSTYNNPRALALVLTGLERQTRPPQEVLIADDGSGAETRALIDDWRRRLPYPVHHVWHPDEGFRKCRILNHAITAASASYLIFLDGDCVPAARCLAVHANRAAPQRYVSGGKVLLGARISATLDEAAVRRGDLERIGRWWLGVKRKRRLVGSRIPGLRDLLDRNVPRPPGWHGENASTWACHARAVGGFDERFTYGSEDADFGQRLLLAGVIGVSVRYTAPVCHLDHARPWSSALVTAANKALYLENRAARVVRTPHGLQCDDLVKCSSAVDS